MKSLLFFLWNKVTVRPTKFDGFLFLSLAVFLLVIMLSFNAVDNSFNRVGDYLPNNLLGSLGAYLADPIFQFFGLAFFIVPITFALWSWRNFFRQGVARVFVKMFSLFLTILALCGIFSYLEINEQWPFYVGYGGFFGDFISSKLIPLIQNKYIIISSLSLVLVLSCYYTFALTLSELGYIYNKVSSFVDFIGRLFVRVLLGCINVVRRVFNKSPISVDAVSQTMNIEEEAFEEYKPKQKRTVTVARQTALRLDPQAFELPDNELLMRGDFSKAKAISQSGLEQNAKLLRSVLEDFGVQGKIVKVRPGPVVTLYELEPSPGTKSSRVIGLSDDIARSMSSVSARIAVIPGRNAIGIELPNSERETVYLRELLETPEYNDQRIKLPIALGKDIGGSSVMTDLSRMPHLLIAGTTGSGKSVAVNAMILSFLYRLSPEECKFIFIDPKMLELSVYDGIPHLLSPVVTEPRKAIVALKWAVREMENRYRMMSNLGVRNIAGYNKRIEETIRKGKKLEKTVQTGFDSETGEPIFETVEMEAKKLPFIVIIVDEMADLMLTAGKDIEASIQRLAQMARAAGIHMVMATQRPSVDVITGVIKANFPTRISFQVTSRIDSRTILGEMGAEQLLGMGDMLYMAGGSKLTRVHGPFVDDKEVEKVVSFLKKQGKPEYIEDVTKDDEEGMTLPSGGGDSGDELYDQAVQIVIRDKKASTSYVQRQLKIGYNRAANLIEKMEAEGIISAANHAGKREILL